MSKTVSKKINTLDIFCGAGGFSAGFTMVNDQYNIIGGIDNNEDAVKTFNKNHQSATGITTDISKTNPKQIAEKLPTQDVNLIIGGPPCKGFSSIRPNRSNDEIDYRNYLYKDYLRFVDYFEPEVFVMENVPEIINHTIADQDILEKITADIEDIGYTYEWVLLNSAYYGVPQARTRFILIGTKSNTAEISFPKPTHCFENEALESSRIRYSENTLCPTDETTLKPVVTVEEAFSDLPSVEAGGKQNTYKSQPNNTFQELMRDETVKLTEHRATNHSEKTLSWLRDAGFTRDAFPENNCPPSGYESTYCRMYPDEPATVVTTEYCTAGAYRSLHPFENRALTVREGMRLQSFPDWYDFCGPKTSIVEQVGNAVPPLLGKAIAYELQKTLQQKNTPTVKK